MTILELKEIINHYVETIKLPTRISGYRLNIILNEILNLIPSGGLTPDTEVGKTLFVSSKGTTAFNGAARENLTTHFSTMAEAVSVAQAGDTIVVYGDQSASSNLHKAGVKWSFVGSPTITLSGSGQWSDSSGASDIIIEGEANIVLTHLLAVVKVANVGTTVNVSFGNVIGKKKPFDLTNGSGVINVTNQILNTDTSAAIQYSGDARYVINADSIKFTGTYGSVSACLISYLFHGHMTFNVREIDCANASGTGFAFYSFNAPDTGTTVLNVTDVIKYTSSVASSFNNKCVFHVSGNLIINGDIDGGIVNAVAIDYASHAKTFVHNGNATNDGIVPLVKIIAPNLDAKFNGIYQSANELVFSILNSSKVEISGQIINDHNTAAAKNGILLVATVNLILDSLKIYFSNVDVTSFGIDAAAAANVKITNNVASNADKGVNITNSITGTTYVYDTDVE